MIITFRDYVEGIADLSDAELDQLYEEAEKLIKNPAFRLILAKIEANAAAAVLSKPREDTEWQRALFQTVQDIRVNLKELLSDDYVTGRNR